MEISPEMVWTILAACGALVGGIFVDLRKRCTRLEQVNEKWATSVAQMQADNNEAINGITDAANVANEERIKTNNNIVHIGHKLETMHSDLREVLRSAPSYDDRK